jgi:hypothetical protein
VCWVALCLTQPTYLEQNLVKEAEEKIAGNCKLQEQTLANIKKYNQAVKDINNCLSAMQLYEYQLPIIIESETITQGEVE